MRGIILGASSWVEVRIPAGLTEVFYLGGHNVPRGVCPKNHWVEVLLCTCPATFGTVVRGAWRVGGQGAEE